jgi:hypothetical protein
MQINIDNAVLLGVTVALGAPVWAACPVTAASLWVTSVIYQASRRGRRLY